MEAKLKNPNLIELKADDSLEHECLKRFDGAIVNLKALGFGDSAQIVEIKVEEEEAAEP